MNSLISYTITSHKMFITCCSCAKQNHYKNKHHTFNKHPPIRFFWWFQIVYCKHDKCMLNSLYKSINESTNKHVEYVFLKYTTRIKRRVCMQCSSFIHSLPIFTRSGVSYIYQRAWYSRYCRDNSYAISVIHCQLSILRCKTPGYDVYFIWSYIKQFVKC